MRSWWSRTPISPSCRILWGGRTASVFEYRSRTYEADFGRLSYSDIADLPWPGVDGNALLIGGTDMSSIAAGGHFMTTEKSVSALLKCIGVHPGQSLPYFEVLLKADVLLYTVQGTDIISCRMVK